MRVFVIGASAPFPDTMEKHVVEGLQALGHTATLFNQRDVVELSRNINRAVTALATRFFREPERLVERRMRRAVADFRPDLVLVLLGNSLSPKTVHEIRKVHRGPVVCWCQDQMTTLGRQYLLGAGYDHVFVKDHYLVRVFRDYAGLPVHYLPEACNPRVHRTLPLSDEDRRRYGADICTFGNVYYYRQLQLEPLLRYRLRVWGYRPDWLIDKLGDAFTGRPVLEDEKCKAVAAARICLNTLHFGEVEGLNCRTFEVAGCGGFQLVSYSPALAEHFAVGTELDSFATRDELLAKVEHYLANPDQAAAIAAAGQRRAHRDHTYEQRLTTLLALAA